jgi:hypothetical protein
MPTAAARKTRAFPMRQVRDELDSAGYDTTEMPTYNRMWNDRFQGKFPADKNGNVPETALPAIAALYSMPRK